MGETSRVSESDLALGPQELKGFGDDLALCRLDPLTT
jgi:hypothetical protein